MLHDVLLKRKEPLDEFCKGLSSLSILDLVKAYPDLMKLYFVHDEKKQLKSDDIGKSRVSYKFLVQAINDLETGLYHNFISSYTYEESTSCLSTRIPLWIGKGQETLCRYHNFTKTLQEYLQAFFKLLYY